VLATTAVAQVGLVLEALVVSLVTYMYCGVQYELTWGGVPYCVPRARGVLGLVDMYRDVGMLELTLDGGGAEVWESTV